MPTILLRRHRWLAFSILILTAGAASLVPFRAAGQETDAASGQQETVPETIQPGERLKVSVFDFALPGVESWFVRRVNDQGQLQFPLIGGIEIGERSRHELEELVAERFNRTGHMRRPLVAISRLDLGEDHVLVPTPTQDQGARP